MALLAVTVKEQDKRTCSSRRGDERHTREDHFGRDVVRQVPNGATAATLPVVAADGEFADTTTRH